MNVRLVQICILGALWGCTASPKPITYGQDACQSCLMTIVDERHAAELVSTKGKVFKFDAIECMVRNMEEETHRSYALALVCDYDNPGVFIDASAASYIISPAIPSPMGAFLSAVSSEERAAAIIREKGGQVYTWQTLPGALKH